MPTYSYKCPECGAVFDKIRKIAEREKAPCKCGEVAEKAVTAPRSIKKMATTSRGGPLSDKDIQAVPDKKILDLMRECLYIDAGSPTGITWRVPTSNRVKAGQPAFTALTESGEYYYGRFCGISVRAHRVVFYLHNGHWPKGLIDHVDGNRQNNSPPNLREATRALNSANRTARGYCWIKEKGKWRASVKKNARIVSKYFDSEVDARLWYESKKLELYPELNGKFQWNAKSC